MAQTVPSLSIIIPSFNQGQYLEETLLSIIKQQYTTLELIIIDGGSTDNSIDIIKKYEKYISYWVSEQDRGQSHAINKGLEKATGEWVAWMNSDDLYLDGAFNYIFSEVDWKNADFIFGNTCYGKTLQERREFVHDPRKKNSLSELLKFSYSVEHIIPSQSVFIRKSVIDKAGLLDETIHYCMDFEWYCRIFIQTDRIRHYPETMSFFRSQPKSKTGSGNNAFQKESVEIARRYADYLPHHKKREVLKTLNYMTSLWAFKPGGLKNVFQAFFILAKFRQTAWSHPGFRHRLALALKGTTS